MTTKGRTLQETLTSLAPEQVLAAARTFFTGRVSIYATFVDMEGPGWLSLRGQGSEEIVIAAHAAERGTRVTGSTYLFDMQVARFFSSLPPADAPATEAVAKAAGAA